jgi:hypothetical protein
MISRAQTAEDTVSVPCFEVWVLLHYERTDAPFARCPDVLRRIRRTYVPGYQKADDAAARALMARLQTALANGAWLAARAATNDHNPYTAIYKIAQYLGVIAGREDAE